MFTQPMEATFAEFTISDIYAEEYHLGKLGACCYYQQTHELRAQDDEEIDLQPSGDEAQ